MHADSPERRASGPAVVSPWSAGRALAGVAVLTWALVVLRPALHESVIAALYMLLVVAAASDGGLPVALITAALVIACWTHFFAEPLHHSHLARHALGADEMGATASFLVAAVITGRLASRLRDQALQARERERHTAALYELSLAAAMETDAGRMLQRLGEHVVGACRVRTCAFWEAGEDGEWVARASASAETPSVRGTSPARARETRPDPSLVVPPMPWTDLDLSSPPGLFVVEAGRLVPARATARPGAGVFYHALRAEQALLGLMAVARSHRQTWEASWDERLLETAANHAVVALQRERLVREKAAATANLEVERLRASLLSSVSHDLRTPLASIKAAATSLGWEAVMQDKPERQALAGGIVRTVDRLDGIVGNMLDISRLEAGAWKPAQEPYPFTEILATVLARMSDDEADRVVLEVPENLPLVSLDGVQMEQVLWNLLENAVKYTPPHSPLHLQAMVVDAPETSVRLLEVHLRDHGPGIPAGEERKIFQKFYRAQGKMEGGPSGVGLGLAICQGIVEAHGGRIWAENHPDGGAQFVIQLPLEEPV